MQSNFIMIDKEEYILGMLLLGDGAKIYRTLLLNILVSDKNISVAVLELVDFQGHLPDQGDKDGDLICNRFLKNIYKIDQNKDIPDVIMFVVASNVQLGGDLFKVYYPNLIVMNRFEHTVSIFFSHQL